MDEKKRQMQYDIILDWLMMDGDEDECEVLEKRLNGAVVCNKAAKNVIEDEVEDDDDWDADFDEEE